MRFSSQGHGRKSDCVVPFRRPEYVGDIDCSTPNDDANDSCGRQHLLQLVPQNLSLTTCHHKISMPGIFISYRRTDTIAWAGRLFADLSRCFGKSQVFMDINGGIPRGSDFEQVLTSALSGCDALLALIGPEWVDCKRSDGRPRLDVPDDWVRNEIATALQRNITVMPVLFSDARLPEEAKLPQDLRPLRKRQTAEVSDTRWDYDIGELIRDLVKLTSLKPLEKHDVASAKTGLLLLKDLMMTKPAVADAVSRSKEVIANTYRQLRKLGLFKTIHDALHYIELQCLQPIQAVGHTSRLRPHKISFTGQTLRIRNAIQDPEIDSALRDDIMDQLDVTTAAFEMAAAAPGSDTYAPLVSELNALLSSLPTRLDSGIVAAAEELKLDRLVELMKTVRSVLLAAVPEHDSELEPLVQGMTLSRGCATNSPCGCWSIPGYNAWIPNCGLSASEGPRRGLWLASGDGSSGCAPGLYRHSRRN